jgi:hypothetical protein
MLAARQQRVHVLSLGRPRPVGGLSRQSVTLQHDYALEVIGERGRGRQPTYSRSNHDRLSADGSGHDHHLRAQRCAPGFEVTVRAEKVSESRTPRPDQTWLYGARIVQHLELMFKPISPVSSAD